MKRYFQNVTYIVRSIFSNWRVLLLFEFVYMLIGSLGLYPFFRFLLRKSLAHIDAAYIELGNLLIWLRQPLTLLVLLVCFVLGGLYIFYQMSALALYFDCARKKENLSFFSLWKEAFVKAFPVLLPKNWALLFFVLAIFPLTSLSLTPAALTKVRIPEYFVDFFKGQGSLYYFYIAALIGLNILVFYMLFVIPVFLLEKKSFLSAFRESRKLMKKHFLKTLISYVMWQIGVTVVFVLLWCGAISLLSLQYYLMPDSVSSAAGFQLDYMQLKQYAGFIFQIITFTGSLAIIMYSYFRRTGLEVMEEKRKKKHSWKTAVLGVLEVILIVMALGFYFDYQGNASAEYNIMRKPIEVVAHRAGTLFAPENTIPALEYTISTGAAYAEIDVQQSRDGELYILHDTNFRRTAGVNKNVWDVTSDEIDTYDAGVLFSGQFKGTGIPRLEDMIRAADGKIKLMIELKENGHSQGLAEKTVKLIKEYGFEDQCVIASMDLELLTKVKGLESKMTTAYIAPVAYGDYYDLEQVDIFSVEATFVNHDMINSLHRCQKQAFVWTVNRGGEFKRLLSMDIDGIVTDNPELAFYYKQAGKRDDFMDEIMKILFPESSALMQMEG
ncbi:glycerophosphoryl diester phosphodiesterase membrane domain-containing protein [Lacrimispora sp. NSJ-141]|uniref:Glycerophosphoryl diester phosphodiesterase membrane domain-containing protein n=1 Tax=Lientehia hominis TaxID=2897778 RepID=A0AAP2WA10_9FIRM|nr:glycerophosphoryl diester phosphodiesterase membrane domain-containing protein [Lientehia hominis]MCD2492429.1 glycerophosphoryl diester phosphodiesterase membrane domain-containing protein [Lientehia hominis]